MKVYGAYYGHGRISLGLYSAVTHSYQPEIFVKNSKQSTTADGMTALRII